MSPCPGHTLKEEEEEKSKDRRGRERAKREERERAREGEVGRSLEHPSIQAERGDQTNERAHHSKGKEEEEESNAVVARAAGPEKAPFLFFFPS